MRLLRLGTLRLKVDGLEIISLVDNLVDFLSAIDKKASQSVEQRTKKAIW